MIERNRCISLDTGLPPTTEDEAQIQIEELDVLVVDEWNEVSLTYTQMDCLVSLWQQWKSQTPGG